MTATCQGCGVPIPPSRGGPPRKWCSERCRKAQYAGTCEVCGGPTDGASRKGHAATVCKTCLTWTGEAIIDAVGRWASEHDGIPPREIDWSPAPEGYPSATVVVRRLGWNRALLAAGFQPHMDKRPETQAWIIEQLRAGRSPTEIANDLGVTRQAVHQRMYWRGLTITAVRAGEPVRP